MQKIIINCNDHFNLIKKSYDKKKIILEIFSKKKKECSPHTFKAMKPFHIEFNIF